MYYIDFYNFTEYYSLSMSSFYFTSRVFLCFSGERNRVKLKTKKYHIKYIYLQNYRKCLEREIMSQEIKINCF